MNLHDLPPRAGDRPRTSTTAPHTQLDQTAPEEMQNLLRDHALSLPGVSRASSGVSVHGAVGFYLNDPPRTPELPELFGQEFGHIHPPYDGSLHLNVPTSVAERLIELGWAEYHFAVKLGWAPPLVVMLYGPRDREELEVAQAIVETSYIAAGGALRDAAGRPLTALHKTAFGTLS